MCVSLVNHFKTEVCSVQKVCPRINHSAIAILDGLVEVKAVEVECHGGDAEGGKPDADDRPRCEKEVQ